MILLTFLLAILSFFYGYVKYCYRYWSNRGIPTLKPVFFFGNVWETFLGKKHMFVPITEAYNHFKDYKYIGFYKCLLPAVIVKDPELIGRILVKDFSHFEDNEIFVDEKVDMLMARNLFAMKGHHWKSKKSLMSPMFTSGKLKNMFSCIESTSDRMVHYLRKEIDAERGKCINGKHLAWKFTTQNVANCAFGLDAQAFETNSEFVQVAEQFGNPSIINALKINVILMLPALGNYLSLSFFSKSVQDYLFNIVESTIRYRKENKVVRNDFLDMICQLKEKSTEYKFDDNDVTAQAAGFFGDGIETSSIVISYCLYEIASNRELQDRLRQEIATVKSRCDDKITYDGVNEMTYLDSVLNETLRLHTPLMVLVKTCTKTYELPPSNKGMLGLVLQPGNSVIIPVEGLHRDAAHFPEPEKFVPERFTSDGKTSIRNYTYLPFGEGPRYCLGMRFGVLQVKIAIIAIIDSFKIEINEKMRVPLELDPGTFLRMPIGGFWFDISHID